MSSCSQSAVVDLWGGAQDRDPLHFITGLNTGYSQREQFIYVVTEQARCSGILLEGNLFLGVVNRPLPRASRRDEPGAHVAFRDVLIYRRLPNA